MRLSIGALGSSSRLPVVACSPASTVFSPERGRSVSPRRYGPLLQSSATAGSGSDLRRDSEGGGLGGPARARHLRCRPCPRHRRTAAAQATPTRDGADGWAVQHIRAPAECLWGVSAISLAAAPRR